MAKVKDFISKASGLIGQAMVDYAPIAMAKENALKETETAAAKANQDKLELLYKENNDTIGKIYDYAAKSGGIMTPELQQQIDDLTYRNRILRGAMFGVDLSVKEQSDVDAMLSGKEVKEKKTPEQEKEVSEKQNKNIFTWLISQYPENMVRAAIEELGPDANIFDLVKEIRNRTTSSIPKDNPDFRGPSSDLKSSQSQLNRAPGFIVPLPASGGEKGLFPEEGLLSQADQAALDSQMEASMAGQGTAMASSDISQEQMDALAMEQQRQMALQQEAIIGSPEALSSLYQDVGGPVGEPAGDTIVERANIPSEAPELEQRKQNIITTLKDLIISAESNVNNYSAVAGSTEGDQNLTSMTLGEIIDKHGNKAVGAGQFKYKEFILPILKKYLGMSEAEAKDQLFTEQFQDDLIRLGLEDAGLSQYVRNEISKEEFQKRIANIWRGLPPTKETKEGETTDQYGNKARVEGGLLFQSLGE